MKLLCLGIALIINIAFASDPVVEKLKAENKALQKQIEQNKQTINLRKKSDFTIITKTKKKLAPNSIFSMGFTKLDFDIDPEFENNYERMAPTVSYTYMMDQVWVEASFTRSLMTSFPANGISTLVGIAKLDAKYKIETSIEGLTLLPTLGYAYIYADSPDAGNTSDKELAKIEREAIGDIESNKGLYTGVSLSKTFLTNWLFSTNVQTMGELGPNKYTYGMNLGYIF